MSGEKRKESETLVTTIETSPRGGEKHKRTKKVVAEAVSTEEIEEAMGSFLVAGPSTWPDPVVQVLDSSGKTGLLYRRGHIYIVI